MTTSLNSQSSRVRFILHSAFNLPHSRPITILSLLTIFAGIIRFTRLAHPPLWYDESMVFWRTCGSYGQLLDCLRTDGFVPLHYSLIWVITRIFRPTPFVLRFIPALAGTLMVPAVYFLARQLLDRSASLLAAAFTACSAFMLFYSRDAKMYMDAWLFVTLNTACLLWWFRTNRSTAWLCWIATGCAACGLQFTSAIPVAISSLLLCTQSEVRWQGVLLWVLGVVVILAGPVGYYEKFNVWIDRTDENWSDSGLQWIGAYNYGRTGPQLVRCLGTNTLMGWEWPKDADVGNIPSGRIAWPSLVFEMLIGIFVIGCLPWPRRWHSKPDFSLTPSPGTPGEGRGEGDFERRDALENPNHPHPNPLPEDRERGPEPQWRVALWLSFLIVIPVYGFYCRSMADFSTPLDWWHAASEQFPILLLPMHHPLLWIPIALVSIALGILAMRFNQMRPMILRGLQMIMVIAVILTLCQVIAIFAIAGAAAAEKTGKPWESIWVPRYIGFIWPALAVAIAALIMRLPTWPVRTLAILFLLGLNLGIAGFRIFGDTEPPVDRMAADLVDAENPSHHTLAWMNLKQGMQSPGGANLFSGPGEYYIDVLGHKSTTPREFKLAIQQREKDMQLIPVPWYLDLPADVDRVIIWNQMDDKPLYTANDPPPPPGWKPESEEWFEARDVWIWRDLGRYHRRVYAKSEIRNQKSE